MKAADLSRLAAFFPPEDLEWKPIAVSKKTGKALVAAYIPNRAIQDRLDEVCGPADWRNEFKEGPAGGVLCGISIYVEREGGTAEWVTKWDGAENTDVEAVKGGLSGSMKRAASQWNIGRYLYSLPSPWVPVDERGRLLKPPPIPAAFVPPTAGDTLPAPEPASPSQQPASPSQQPASPSRQPASRVRKTSNARSGKARAADDDVRHFVP